MPIKIPAETHQKLIEEGKYIVSEIDMETIRSIENWILHNRLGQNQSTEFTLLINSSGGSPGLVLYFSSFTKTLADNVKIIGVTFGECGSAALALLQCCHERVAVKHSAFFIHNIRQTFTVGCQEVNYSAIRQKIENSKNTEDELVRLQSDRCGMSVRKWKSLAKRGQASPGSAILTDEAKKLGLIDSVIDQYPIF